MKEKDLIKKIVDHFEKISGGIETINQRDPISKKDFDKEIADIESFNNSAVINSLLLEIWNKFNGQIFKNEIGIKPSEKIPILEQSELIEFTRFFSVEKSGDSVLDMIKSNNDIFGNRYIPFAEALEGDFFALNNENNAIYYIMHDFGDEVKYCYKVAEKAEKFFLSLKAIEPLTNDDISTEPKIVSSNLSNSLLSKLKNFK